jgi:Ca2+-binding RTX toxin-like protein
VISGGRGNDTMRGKSGGDYIVGNDGTDSANGGLNRDWCDAENETSCEGPAGPFRLKPNGIGSIPFGTPTDTALVEFALLGDPMLEGAPDEDSGWVDSFSIWGTCPNDEVRMVRWGNLRTFFTRTGLTEGEFFFWDVSNGIGYEDLKLATPKGLRLGHTRGQLELLYKHVDVVYIDVFDIWHFYTQNNPSGVTGSLEDGGLGAVIIYLQGGIGCGE